MDMRGGLLDGPFHAAGRERQGKEFKSDRKGHRPFPPKIRGRSDTGRQGGIRAQSRLALGGCAWCAAKERRRPGAARGHGHGPGQLFLPAANRACSRAGSRTPGLGHFVFPGRVAVGQLRARGAIRSEREGKGAERQRTNPPVFHRSRGQETQSHQSQ